MFSTRHALLRRSSRRAGHRLSPIDPKKGTQPGKLHRSPGLAAKVVRVFRDIRPATRFEADLTPEQLRLLRFLAEGHSYQAAGAELEITVNTVRKHVRAIYDKLHVHSKSAAVAKALRAGVI